MEFEVKWEVEDQESKEKDVSRAKTISLGLGEKKVDSPSRGIKISNETSDFQLWNEMTGGILYPRGLAFMHMGVYPKTLENLAKSNGKFNEKVVEASTRLGVIDDRAIKVIFPRIPKTQGLNIKITEDNIVAALDFLNKANGNDANILPLPPTGNLINNISSVTKGIQNVYTTLDKSKRKPLIGYIPAFDDPGNARKVLEMYLGLENKINVFVIDFANGRNGSYCQRLDKKTYTGKKEGGVGGLLYPCRKCSQGL